MPLPPDFTDRLTQSPVIQSLIAGESPPVYATRDMLSPETQANLPEVAQGLAQAGLGLVEAPKTGVVVMFNPSVYGQDEVLAADAAGTLDDIAVPLSGGAAAPAGAVAPGGSPAPAAPGPSLTAGLTSPSGPSAGSQTDLATTRTNNVVAKPPTQTPAPASGSIFNGLIKRPV